MKRSYPTLLAGAALLATAWVAVPGGANADEPSLVANPHAVSISPFAGVNQEPVLVYTVIGYGIAGPLNCSLTVYNNGVSFVAEENLINTDGSAMNFNVSPAEATQLRLDLLAAGAASLGDNPLTGADIPLTTVTFFPGAFTRGKANTFNYYFPVGGQVAVDQVIKEFILEHAPGFCLLSPFPE